MIIIKVMFTGNRENTVFNNTLLKKHSFPLTQNTRHLITFAP